jgi:hypothetical protein
VQGAGTGAIFYTLETDEVGGIFSVDAAGQEDRLFHTADFRVRLSRRVPIEAKSRHPLFIRISAPTSP